MVVKRLAEKPLLEMLLLKRVNN
ncbi:Protein of unknown function [Bacillus mycoides]|nr:Protein of unknown function [Bacillus mycoides]